MSSWMPASWAISASVMRWAAAWSSRDLDAYFASYEPNFNGGKSRAAWMADRKARILPRNKIDVDVSDFAVSLNGDRASVRFRQAYASDSLSVTSRKTLDLIKSGNRWLIVRESTGS